MEPSFLFPAEVLSFLFPVIWRQKRTWQAAAPGRLAAGLDLLVRKGYMRRLRSVPGTGRLSVRSMQLQNLLSPIFGWHHNRALRWTVEQVPVVYHMEGSAIGAKGVQ